MSDVILYAFVVSILRGQLVAVVLGPVVPHIELCSVAVSRQCIDHWEVPVYLHVMIGCVVLQLVEMLKVSC